MKSCSRVLSAKNQVKDFLTNALQISCTDDNFDSLIRLMTSAEMQQAHIIDKGTLSSVEYRDSSYNSDESRIKLRSQIYHELITQQRPINDDEIKLGASGGGALPRTDLREEKQAFYIIGLPASGKSMIANTLSDKYGAIILDSDFAKRKFPEYADDYGASVVHDESSMVIFGGNSAHGDEPAVISYAIENKCNIIIPKIGNDSGKVLNLASALRSKGYKSHLVLVRLSREEATKRALNRFKKTKRYVPLSMIFDEYANDPTITFYDIKDNIYECNKGVFKSFTMVSTVGIPTTPPQIIYKSTNSPLADIFK